MPLLPSLPFTHIRNNKQTYYTCSRLPHDIDANRLQISLIGLETRENRILRPRALPDSCILPRWRYGILSARRILFISSSRHNTYIDLQGFNSNRRCQQLVIFVVNAFSLAASLHWYDSNDHYEFWMGPASRAQNELDEFNTAKYRMHRGADFFSPARPTPACNPVTFTHKIIIVTIIYTSYCIVNPKKGRVCSINAY